MSEPLTAKNKDAWDKLGVLAQLMVPVVLAVIGLAANSTLKHREMNAEYVRLAISTLQNADRPNSGREVKKWAFNVLREMSPVPMPPEVEADALGLQIQHAAHRTTGGFGSGSGWGFVQVRATDSLELFVYVDGYVRATTPSTLNLSIGRHHIEFRTGAGRTLGETYVDILDWPTQTVTYSRGEQALVLGEIRGARMPVEVLKEKKAAQK